MAGLWGTGLQVVTSDERWFNEISLGRAFAGSIVQAAVAGQQSHTQLFNPLGSGVRVLLFAYHGVNDVNSVLIAAHHNTALTTLGGNGRNLLSGGAASQATIRSQTNAGSLGSEFDRLGILANAGVDPRVSWITELGPGEGCNLLVNVNNSNLHVGFYWIELPT